MRKRIRQLLKQAIFDIFADMFYLFPEERPDQVETPLDDTAYSIDLSGEAHITITCHISATLARLMTANFLGEDKLQVSAFLVDETLKEALNVIAGQLLVDLPGTWSLGFPRTVSGAPPGGLTEEPPIVLRVEGETFLALIATDLPNKN